MKISFEVSRNIFFSALIIVTVTLLNLELAQAIPKKGARISGGDGSISFGIALVTANQDDINRAIDAAASNAASLPVSTKAMGSALEFWGQYNYRFSGSMFSVLFRPSYFTQSTTGSGTNGSYDFKLNGFTFFPMLRMTPLENDFISFFFQMGLGYGRLNGDITAGPNSVKFSGGNFGAMGGVGADFCFIASHCISVEGNFRYLPIERNIASSGTGVFPGFSQTGADKEVENASGNDFQTTMSGIMGTIAYTYMF